jgi:DNA (cytosine-5)-methyltransferase 1
LFLEFVRIVEEVRPRFFLMENVRGLRSAALKHRPLNSRGEEHPPLSEEEELGSLLSLGILPAFEGIGYQVAWGVLNALDYGAAQDRARLFIIGSIDDELPGDGEGIDDLVRPTHSRKGRPGMAKAKVLGQVIADLEDDPGECMKYSPNRAEVFERIPEGKNWRYVRDSGLFSQQELEEFMGGAYSSTGGRVGFWRRLSYDKWSPTLTTSPVQKATGLCHPRQTRPLSVNEYARIQGFPDDWEFSGPIANRYRQIGNAVPVELGHAVGTALIDLIEKSPPEI